MGRVQKSLLPYLNQCFRTPLTAQEEGMVSILEVRQVEHPPHAAHFARGSIDNKISKSSESWYLFCDYVGCSVNFIPGIFVDNNL